MKRRHAFTLTELLMTMTIGTGLLASAMGVLHQSMRLSSLNKSSADHDRSVDRLAQIVRDDVHRAKMVAEITPDSLHLELDDGTQVVYQRTDTNSNDFYDVIERTHRQRNDQVHHESYAFKKTTRIEFASLQAPDRVRVTLFRPLDITVSEPKVEREVIAVVDRRGSHLRKTNTQPTSEESRP